MSLDATRWAWQQDVRPSHKLVLLSLADRAGEDHSCYPSFDRLTIDTGLHKETIIEAIHQLEKLRLVKVSRTDGKSNKYSLIGVQSRTDADQYGKPDRFSDQYGKPTSPEKQTAPVRKTGHDQYGKPDPNLPIESTKNHKSHINLDFSSWPALPDNTILHDWMLMRKRMKADVSQTVVNRFGKQLTIAVANGHSVDDCISECVTRGWKGFDASWMKQQQENNKKERMPWDGAVGLS